MELKNEENLYSTHPLSDLGVDGINDLDIAYLREKFNKHKPVKELLLDQSIIAGIGNIYADEICFKAKIDPRKEGIELSDNNLKDISYYTKKTLEEAILAGGTTIRSYTSSLGVTGRFQQSLEVHTLSKCLKCGTDILKIRVGGRGTYYCPNCQKR